MSWTNYHNHCHYCDGSGTVEEHVTKAIANDIFSLGFSCHCPVPFENNWSIHKDQLQQYLDEIETSRQKYQGRIAIYKGLEVDFIPGMVGPADESIKLLNLDFTVGSVHFVGEFANGRPWVIDGSFEEFLKGLTEIYKGDVRYVIQRYFEQTRQMMRESCPDIVGHVDKIKIQNHGLWDEQSDWYRKEVLETLEEIKSSGAIVEVNTRGIYKKLTEETYPSPWILQQLLDMEIPVQINADSHAPDELTNEFASTYELIHAIGFRKLKVMLNGDWEFVDVNQYGLEHADSTYTK